MNRLDYPNLIWPLHEPVDGAAIDDRWEHSEARSEGFAHWRHAQHNVDVGLDAIDVLMAEHVADESESFTDNEKNTHRRGTRHTMKSCWVGVLSGIFTGSHVEPCAYLREDVQLCGRDALLGADRPAGCHDAVHLLWPVQIGYIARVEDIVDVF